MYEHKHEGIFIYWVTTLKFLVREKNTNKKKSDGADGL